MKSNEVENQMSPSRVMEGEQRGWIVPIGGAEEKENDPRILERFVQLCGGSDANIVVIPTASQLAVVQPVPVPNQPLQVQPVCVAPPSRPRKQENNHAATSTQKVS